MKRVFMLLTIAAVAMLAGCYKYELTYTDPTQYETEHEGEIGDWEQNNGDDLSNN